MSLCIDCGCAFCCDGTLYGWAPVQDDDFPVSDDAFEVQRESVTGQNKAFFKLPCKLCLNGRCSIHEEKRPAICGDFQCKLLAGHASGSVCTEAARALVDNVKKLQARLMPQMEKFVGDGGALSLFHLTQLVADTLEKMNEVDRQAVSPKMLLDLAMMRVLLAKNFDSRLMKYTYLAEKELLAMEDASEPLVQSAADPGK
jgi:hypothetical protein